jgi:hypothetical protein
MENECSKFGMVRHLCRLKEGGHSLRKHSIPRTVGCQLPELRPLEPHA